METDAPMSGAHSKDATKYDLLYESRDPGGVDGFEVLTPPIWLKLLASDTLENETFHVKPKSGPSSRSKQEYYDKTSNLQHVHQKTTRGVSFAPPPPSSRASSRAQESGRSRPYAPSLASNKSCTQSDRGPADTPAAEQEIPPREGSGTITAPFFTWRLRSGKDTMSVNQVDEGLAGQAAIQDLFRVLGKINDSILSDSSGVGELYARAYKCTKESLLERHPDLRGRTSHNSPSKVESPHLSQLKHGDRDKTQEKGACPEKAMGSSNKGGTKLQVSAQSNERPSDTPTSVLDQVKALSEQLLEVSEAIICEFIPNDERSLQYHALCERFWGTTDEILRVRTIRII